jgi:hypothetical protein
MLSHQQDLNDVQPLFPTSKSFFLARVDCANFTIGKRKSDIKIKQHEVDKHQQ